MITQTMWYNIFAVEKIVTNRLQPLCAERFGQRKGLSVSQPRSLKTHLSDNFIQFCQRIRLYFLAISDIASAFLAVTHQQSKKCMGVTPYLIISY